jgi:Na+-driven multidrug efflux pump
LGYIIGIPLEWGICGMWVAFLLDENIRGAIFVKRWYSMKWTTKGFVK